MCWVKAISIDVHGTLLDKNRSISLQNMQQLERAKKNKIMVIINTLSPYNNEIQDIAKRVNADYVISSFGRYIFDKDGELIYKITGILSLMKGILFKINKGTTLEFLCEMLNIPMCRVLAIGNGFYDIPMLKIAGFGVALKNAPSIVKKRDDYYISCSDNNESGVAMAIRQFIV